MVIHPSPDDDPGARALCFPVDEFREAVRALGTLRHDYRRHLYVELSPSWGPNFYSRGVYRFLSARRTICPAGTTRLALHPETGLVYPCMKLTGRPNYAIGHWDSHQKTVVLDPARNVLARLAKDSSLLKGICAVDSCPYATLCRGGCRAVAAAYADGDLLAGMPYCLTRVLDELET